MDQYNIIPHFFLKGLSGIEGNVCSNKKYAIIGGFKCWFEKIKDQMNALLRGHPYFFPFSAPGSGTNTNRQPAITAETACVLNPITH
jgi:hypothetical protein